MKKLPKFVRTYQNFIVSGSILFFCILGLFLVTLPFGNRVRELYAEVDTIVTETDALTRKLNTLNSLDEGTLRQQLGDVLSAVPSDRSYPTLFETVEGVAAQTGVSIVNMNITGGTSLATASASKATVAEKQLGTRTVPFSVSVTGTVSQIRDFIALAPSVRRLLRIRTFNISYPEEERPLTITIDMDAFYEPLPSSIGSAKSVLPNITDAEIEVINKLSQLPLASGASASLPPPAIGQARANPFAP
jgi:hypothetical protein